MADDKLDVIRRVQLETPTQHIGFAAQFFELTETDRKDRALELLEAALLSSESLSAMIVDRLQILMVLIDKDARLLSAVERYLDNNAISSASEHWEIILSEFPNVAALLYQSVGLGRVLNEEQLVRLKLADSATKAMVERIEETHQIDGRSLEILLLIGGWNNVAERTHKVRDFLIGWYVGVRANQVAVSTLRCYLTAMFGRDDVIAENADQGELAQLRIDLKNWFQSGETMLDNSGWPLHLVSRPFEPTKITPAKSTL